MWDLQLWDLQFRASNCGRTTNGRHPRVLGDPQPPDTSNMSPKEEKQALERFEKERRRWLDSYWNKIAKDTHEANISTSSPSRAQL